MKTKSVLQLLHLTHIQTTGKGIVNMGMYMYYTIYFDFDEMNQLFFNIHILLIENVVIIMVVKTHIEHRNGCDYVAISNIAPASNTLVNALRGEVNFQYDDAHPIVNSIVNHMANGNFDSFKGCMDRHLNKYVLDVIKSVITGLFDEIPVQSMCRQKQTSC